MILVKINMGSVLGEPCCLKTQHTAYGMCKVTLRYCTSRHLNLGWPKPTQPLGHVTSISQVSV